MNLDPYRGDQGDMGDGATEGQGTIGGGGQGVKKVFWRGDGGDATKGPRGPKKSQMPL